MTGNREQAHPPPSDYRGRDISYRGLLYAAAAVAALVGVAAAASWILFNQFQIRQARRDPPASPFEQIRIVPPTPRLQVEPVQDLRAMEAEMEQLLEGYAWVDREQGLVRVPIERAMEIVAERGLPDFGSGTTDEDAGTEGRAP